jgi:hypothetical protein
VPLGICVVPVLLEADVDVDPDALPEA